MTPALTRGLASALLGALCALPVAAADAARPVADPLDPAAAVPALTHRSALTGYVPGTGRPAVDWRDANATVDRIGGWRAYLREVQEARKAPQAKGERPSGPAPSSAPTGAHDHHKMH